MVKVWFIYGNIYSIHMRKTKTQTPVKNWTQYDDETFMWLLEGAENSTYQLKP